MLQDSAGRVCGAHKEPNASTPAKTQMRLPAAFDTANGAVPRNQEPIPEDGRAFLPPNQCLSPSLTRRSEWHVWLSLLSSNVLTKSTSDISLKPHAFPRVGSERWWRQNCPEPVVLAAKPPYGKRLAGTWRALDGSVCDILFAYPQHCVLNKPLLS
jgi:hypothetical protein